MGGVAKYAQLDVLLLPSNARLHCLFQLCHLSLVIPILSLAIPGLTLAVPACPESVPECP